MTAVLTGVEIRFTLGALAFESDFDGRWNDRPAERAPQNFLKSRHVHRPGSFPGFGTARSTFRFFSRFFNLAFAVIANMVLIAVLAVFSFHD